jgi:hypothetical protein
LGESGLAGDWQVDANCRTGKKWRFVPEGLVGKQPTMKTQGVRMWQIRNIKVLAK